MAIKYVKQLIQDEVLIALKAGLSKDYFNVIKADDMAGSRESVDSKQTPILIVSMPEESNISPLSDNISEAQYDVYFTIHLGVLDQHKMEQALSEATDRIRVDLCDYYSDNLRRLSWCRNNITFSEIAPERKGQSSMYYWGCQYKFWIPTTRRIEVPDPPEDDPPDDDPPEDNEP